MTTGFQRSNYLQNSNFFDLIRQSDSKALTPQNLKIMNQIEVSFELC